MPRGAASLAVSLRLIAWSPQEATPANEASYRHSLRFKNSVIVKPTANRKDAAASAPVSFSHCPRLNIGRRQALAY